MRQVIRSSAFLLAASAAMAVMPAIPAWAGGFAVREQSAEFQGMSFAGDAAAGGGLSGMFWNPAVAAYAPKGYSSESDAAGIFGHVDETATAGTSLATLGGPVSLLGLGADSGNIAKPALVPGSYMAYRLSPDAVLALSFNSPFGLATDPANNIWSGQTQARLSDIKTYDAVPTLAFRVMPGLSVGVGVQIDYIKATLRGAAAPSPASPDASIEGQDTALGFTAGLNWTPSSQTSVGLGYRSAISHNLKGTLSVLGATADNPIEAQLKLPDVVTLSARQGISDKLRVLGTVEWTHWSDLQSLNIVCTGSGNPFCAGGNGQPVPLVSLNLGWHDSWMFALGGEYDYSRQLKLRTGIAYEISPIQNPNERTAKLPDQNRVWLSGGASYALNSMIGIDLAYSHIWGLGGGIDRTEPSSAGPVTLIADVSSSVDIISGSVKFKLGGP